MKPSRGLFALVVAATCALMLFLTLSSFELRATPVGTWDEFKVLYENGDLTDVELRDDGVYALTAKPPFGAQGEPKRIVF
ncbi:MAG TPA: hypothetical protein VHC70_14145, partial [Phycisphaerales bacterium]|nr:hypothetical protein [Phycisphaerales bacterium]